ncbi:ribosome-associated protein [Cruoricaptor ignavus]|uniref:Ribosome-associated protein n=1 Tax=Cruoricaptor ignavus TaxID=1118202 RepID=A0A1M6DBZ9_9FLAO|nr:alternative ribosome rescue aminoacyl-tRNA hydrolase ArfB [Cruoricaptor ignavus]SHI70670.1 ribosome-associated protein [Cruoricaptor ignavus]
MRDFAKELTYKTSRSSGAGGQNVNKVETAVAALWKVEDSAFFSEEEKVLIKTKLANRINSEGILQVNASEARTQLQNRKIATEKILALVNAAIIKKKPRKKTMPSKAQIEKRLSAKKKISEKKESRRFKF